MSKKRFFYPRYKKFVRKISEYYKKPVAPGTNLQHEQLLTEIFKQLSYHINRFYPLTQEPMAEHAIWHEKKWGVQ